jgi:hypothetical protein
VFAASSEVLTCVVQTDALLVSPSDSFKGSEAAQFFAYGMFLVVGSYLVAWGVGSILKVVRRAS